ncbi:MAG: PD40 domain-containing protein, partial [Anaerolineaceae bacterium]|nr:PD40 domain-containing protein [Anaerolineaceae bacterium]
LEATLKDDGNFDVGAIAWSLDGNFIAVANQGSQIQIWDVSAVLSGGTAQQVATFENIPANAMMWSPDSHQIAVGVANNVVILDATTGHATSNLIGHEDTVIVVAWSPDGTRLASSGLDHAIRIWDVGTGEAIALILESYVIRAIAWSPDGTQLAYGSDNGSIRIIPVPVTDEVIITPP